MQYRQKHLGGSLPGGRILINVGGWIGRHSAADERLCAIQFRERVATNQTGRFDWAITRGRLVALTVNTFK